MTTVNVRYMVDDVEAAVVFYTKHLGFMLLSKTAPAFADVTRGEAPLSSWSVDSGFSGFRRE